MKSCDLKDVFHKLLNEFGPQGWWPAHSKFEIVIGAILTQQTKWTNVEKAIAQLKALGLLDCKKLSKANIQEIEEIIYCCGFYRQKAYRLKKAAEYFDQRNGDIFKQNIYDLRRELLSLEGIGEETADSIILYAAEKPKFVIDAYTKRMLSCMGIEGDYNYLQLLFEDSLPTDVEIYKEYHALIVRFGKEYCTRKRCNECMVKN
ncbi:endonuclease III domain-containing protein [Methanosalsum natronophilum]|uniref:endonuclease III domain-containing protein n=1 Tax=Methanosalsum natronophilum TaxID=768733 RepID=UPI002168EE74|nr:endonuclease [Methanosalsum natronophilum]MCS3924002.1 endonuclease-3 related protein [Methanosalsum natronophilum]